MSYQSKRSSWRVALRPFGSEWPLLAVLGLQACFLAPTLSTGYVFDDAINSSFTGGLGYKRVTFWAATWKIVRAWIVENGRFFPTSFYQGYAQMHLIHQVTTYKVLLLAFTLAATGCMYWFVRRLDVSAAGAGLSILVATVAFQLRLYHDSLLAYTGLVQLTLIEVLLSAVAFDLWLEHRARRQLVASLVLLVVAGSTYESAYLLVGLHVVVAWKRDRLVPAMRAAAVPVSIAGAFMALALLLRTMATKAESSLYSPSVGVGPVARTFGVEMVGAAPLAYVAFDPDRLFRPLTSTVLTGIGPADVSLAAGLGALTAFFLGKLRSEAANGVRPSRARCVLAAAVVLSAGSALPIAVSPKYQGELHLGLAYLPVLVAYFGVGLVVARLSGWAMARPRPLAIPLSLVAAAVIAMMGLIQHRANAVVVDHLRPDRDHRAAVERALADGLLADVADGSTLYTDIPRPWSTPPFYFQHGGKRVVVRGDPAPPSSGGGCDPTLPSTYALSSSGERQDQQLTIVCVGRAPRLTSGGHIRLR